MTEHLPERIVCAANKFGAHIVLGLRHNDEYMQAAVKALQLNAAARTGIYGLDAQGFLTNKRRWVDRATAYEIANNQEQILRKTGGMNSQTLYSEDVY